MGWGWQVWQERETDLQAVNELLTSLARAGEYQFEGSLRSIEALLDEAADRVDPEHWPDPELERWFTARLKSYPEIRNFVVLDAHGTSVGKPLGRPGVELNPAKVTVADRAYFQEVVTKLPDRRMVVGAPVHSRFSNQTSIPMVKPIVGRDGKLAGMVLLGLDPLVFRDKLNSVMVDEDGGGALFHPSAVFMTRVPRHEEFVGRSAAHSQIFTEYLPEKPSGVAQYVAIVDGRRKYAAYRTLERYPLVVVVATSVDKALAGWRKKTAQSAVVLAAMILAMGVLAWLYDRRDAQLAAGREELERQVAVRTADLAASNAELEQFAYVASHDLQEPLRTITSFLQLLERRHAAQLSDEAREYVAFAVNGAKHMSRVINDLLVFSRVGRADEAPQPCRAVEAVERALANLASSIEVSGAKVENRMDEEALVRCRHGELSSLFQNLIGNALKYRHPERAPVVRVSAEPAPGGMWLFMITDNGIGIEHQYLERIFGIFQRLHPRGRYEGTGIGLALCRKIVERNHGRIWAESEYGKGATLAFLLPAAREGDY